VSRHFIRVTLVGPNVFFEPGDVGQVKHVNSPSVRYGPGKRDLQTVVEFTKHGATQTVRLWNFQVQKLRAGPSLKQLMLTRRLTGKIFLADTRHQG
jgi:hypothetical protein